MKNLIIVESPSKTKTLKKFLGDEYKIEASVGHIRDLPVHDLGVDIDSGFEPKYEVSTEKKKVISELKAAVKKVDGIYLATDPDREGEAIAWHLIEVLKPKIPVKRLVFNEITKSAIKEAFDHVRDIDQALVSAQETRRIVDRLFGYLVSPKLWTNVKRGLSAGRVQSPAIKIIVDREKLRAKFKESEYWSITGVFQTDQGGFESLLVQMDSLKIARGNDFNKMTGKLSRAKTCALNQESANRNADLFKTNKWTVKSIEQKPIVSHPAPPFITSTLQQEGFRKLRMSSKQVMRSAQVLYEGGYITYMRTDSVQLSNEALTAARNMIKELYGEKYLPKKPKFYKNKAKKAQEAHEAIRPAGEVFLSPESLKGEITGKDWQLYELIWKRTVACQMASAKFQQTTVQVTDGNAVFEAKGRIIEFAGHLKAYVSGSDDPEAELENKEKILPALKEGQEVDCVEMVPRQHFTKPAPRFTEASLVKELESLGIGRPSTYAPILSLIQDRGYANKINNALVPTFTAYAVVQFLERYFTDLVELQFTARLEDLLDGIARSEIEASEIMNGFYFGQKDHPGLKTELDQKYDKENSRLIMEMKDKDGNPVQLMIGRYGVYLKASDNNVTVPEEFIPSELTPESICKMFEQKAKALESLGTFPETGEPVFVKRGPKGYYLASGEKKKSLLPGMRPDEVTLDIAVQTLSLPKEIGIWNENPILVDLGFYGPYLKSGTVTRKISAPDHLFEITEQRAIELLEQPPKRISPVILRTLGDEPGSGNSIELKDGRYGAYVTDGKVNVSIPKWIPSEDVTLELAVEWIVDKRARGPVKKKRTRKKAAK